LGAQAFVLIFPPAGYFKAPALHSGGALFLRGRISFIVCFEQGANVTGEQRFVACQGAEGQQMVVLHTQRIEWGMGGGS
jgi:hypothetical protein